MDSLGAPGNSWSKIHVVGYALSVAWANLGQGVGSPVSQGCCVCWPSARSSGGRARAKAGARRPALPVPAAHYWFASWRGCCIMFCFPALLKKCGGKYVVKMNWHSNLLWGGFIAAINNFPRLLFKKQNPVQSMPM